MSRGRERGEVTLRNGDLAIRVSRHGGAITFAEYRATPFLVASGGPDRTMASFPLVPFGNRVAGNAMSFDGRDYRFRPNSPGPLYLHGDGWLALWEIEGEEPQCVRLGFSRIADDVSPYSYQARQEIGISGNTLVLDLSVTNRGEAALPFGLGHHPFFPRTPKTRLTAGAQVFWSERDGHLPAGGAGHPPLCGRQDLAPAMGQQCFRGMEGAGVDHLAGIRISGRARCRSCFQQLYDLYAHRAAGFLLLRTDEPFARRSPHAGSGWIDGACSRRKPFRPGEHPSIATCDGIRGELRWATGFRESGF
jgi:galactose mutarotase-like enzyme